MIQRTLNYDESKKTKIKVEFGICNDKADFTISSPDCMCILHSSACPYSSYQKGIKWIWNIIKEEYGGYETEFVGNNCLKDMSEIRQVQYFNGLGEVDRKLEV